MKLVLRLRSQTSVLDILTRRGEYVKNVSIKEAKELPGMILAKLFILENRDGVKYLNINEVINLDPEKVKPKVGAKSTKCNPVEGLKENNKDYSKKNPRVEFFGGGGVGIKANPIMNGNQLLSIDLVEGGFGFQYPPFAKFVDDRGFSTQGY